MRCEMCGKKYLDEAWMLPKSRKEEPVVCYDCMIDECSFAEDQDEVIECVSCGEVIPEGLFYKGAYGTVCENCMVYEDDNELDLSDPWNDPWLDSRIKERMYE